MNKGNRANTAEKKGYLQTLTNLEALSSQIQYTLSKNGRKFRDAFVYIFFQASWAKNFDLLRVIAVHGTMTIEFYVKFCINDQKFSLLGPTLLWF